MQIKNVQIKKECQVGLEQGLHARTTAQLMQRCCQFNAEVRLENDNGIAEAKSILQVLSLCITQGSTVTIIASGSDAAKAVDDVYHYLKAG